MSTDDFAVTFVGGPLHGQHKRLALGTVNVRHDGVAYSPSASTLPNRGAFDITYFVAEKTGQPDGVDIMREARMSVRDY